MIGSEHIIAKKPCESNKEGLSEKAQKTKLINALQELLDHLENETEIAANGLIKAVNPANKKFLKAF